MPSSPSVKSSLNAASNSTPDANSNIKSPLPTTHTQEASNHRSMLFTAIETSDVTLLNFALDKFRAHRNNPGREETRQFVIWALRLALNAGSVGIVTTLLDLDLDGHDQSGEGNKAGKEREELVKWIMPSVLGRAAHRLLTQSQVGSDVGDSGIKGRDEGGEGTEDTLERFQQILTVIRTRGWDINQIEGPPGTSATTVNNHTPNYDDLSLELDCTTLLHELCFNEDLVRWCVEHEGAVPALAGSGLLPRVAAAGTLSTLKYLDSCGAIKSRKLLHRAVESAAYAISDLMSASPADALGNESAGQQSASTPNPTLESTANEKKAIVTHILTKLNYDINALDIAPDTPPLPNSWGTPICYAIHAGGQGAVVMTKHLLSRGANPYIRDAWGLFDAFHLAELERCENVLSVLREWQA